MRIGVYGGTFNPIHKTHIEIAEAARIQYELDRVYFLVAGTPPHKDTAENIADSCRLEMVEIAINGHKDFFIDDREIYRCGKSYSYITLGEYKEAYPNDDIFFIMGSDSLLNFKNWVKPEIISNAATILVAPRLGDDLNKIKECLEEYKATFSGAFALINYEANEVSSSYTREHFYDNEKSREHLDCQVAAYILDHDLYRNVMLNMDIILVLDEERKKELKPGRYTHTIGVAHMAYDLAIRWNYPALNAMAAGMLHDCAKCISDEKRISVCEKNDIKITAIEYKYPHLLHGKVGAFYAKTKYGIEDQQIMHSIEVHTTGCPNMSLLDKIIFVADYIEPGRDKQPRLDLIRSMAFSDLDLCVFLILEDSVNYLNTNPDMIDPTTIDTFKYYKKLIEER
jgi:nicotinate-nucleotide adenylyltransferase